MEYSIEELEKEENFRSIKEVPYSELLSFVMEYLRVRSPVTISFWLLCLLLLIVSIITGVNLHNNLPAGKMIIHSAIGLVLFPVIVIPVHEFLHIIPYWFSGAKNIRVGMDPAQFLFYVSAHRHVASPKQFIIVALVPFLIISMASAILIFTLSPQWSWSILLFLLAHTTMCAGDLALLNFYWVNRGKEIYTWDDADIKVAYFYARLH
jgi:hypothetical protein